MAADPAKQKPSRLSFGLAVPIVAATVALFGVGQQQPSSHASPSVIQSNSVQISADRSLPSPSRPELTRPLVVSPERQLIRAALLATARTERAHARAVAKRLRVEAARRAAHARKLAAARKAALARKLAAARKAAIARAIGVNPSANMLLVGARYIGKAPPRDPTHRGDCVGRAISAGIPRNYLILYQKAAQAYGLGPDGWAYLAAFGLCETDHGQSDLPGVRSGGNFAGARGPMQFMPASWKSAGVDGNHDGRKSVYDPRDAIDGAAHYLVMCGDVHPDGQVNRYRGALCYNHSPSYAKGIVIIARAYQAEAQATRLNVPALVATPRSPASAK